MAAGLDKDILKNVIEKKRGREKDDIDEFQSSESLSKSNGVTDTACETTNEGKSEKNYYCQIWIE